MHQSIAVKNITSTSVNFSDKDRKVVFSITFSPKCQNKSSLLFCIHAVIGRRQEGLGLIHNLIGKSSALHEINSEMTSERTVKIRE